MSDIRLLTRETILKQDLPFTCIPKVKVSKRMRVCLQDRLRYNSLIAYPSTAGQRTCIPSYEMLSQKTTIEDPRTIFLPFNISHESIKIFVMCGCHLCSEELKFSKLMQVEVWLVVQYTLHVQHEAIL